MHPVWRHRFFMLFGLILIAGLSANFVVHATRPGGPWASEPVPAVAPSPEPDLVLEELTTNRSDVRCFWTQPQRGIGNYTCIAAATPQSRP